MKLNFGYSLLFAVALLLGACGKDSKPPAPKVLVADVAQISTQATLSVLATSDLRDAQPLEEMVKKDRKSVM